jgi:hypothetical protein
VPPHAGRDAERQRTSRGEKAASKKVARLTLTANIGEMLASARTNQYERGK